MQSFQAHLHEALELGQQRRDWYAARSQGLSKPVSRDMLLLDRLALPAAWWIDRSARKFQQAGVPVISGDLVGMESVLPPETPPRRKRIWTEPEWADYDAQIRSFSLDVGPHLREFRFGPVADSCRILLEKLTGLEERYDGLCAITKHVVESVGWSAQHAVEYSERTSGATAPLCRRWIRIQLLSLFWLRRIDRRAQPVHALGLGIVQNEMPVIPFPS